MTKSRSSKPSPGAYSERPVSEERIPVPDLAQIPGASAKRTVDDLQPAGRPARASAPLGVYGPPAAKASDAPGPPDPSSASASAETGDGLGRSPNESGVVVKSVKPGEPVRSGTLRGFRAPKSSRPPGAVK